MTKKNVLFCIVLFVLTALTSTYYNVEIHLRTLAETTYDPKPLLTLRIIFPLFWGIILFVLVYCQRIEEKSHRLARMTIEAVFLLTNILYVLVNFYQFFAFPSYTLILTGLLCAGIIFEIIQVFVSKRIPASPIQK